MDYPIRFAGQLSQHLRSSRKARGLTQARLAQMLGITQSRVAQIESDPTAVAFDQLFQILVIAGRRPGASRPDTRPLGRASNLSAPRTEYAGIHHRRLVMRELSVWMNGELVGVWSRGRTGHHRFDYQPDWLRSPRARSLSLSLPITASRRIEGSRVENFFDNLLPDSEAIRRRLRDRFRTDSIAVFQLLEAVGRDCVGAVQLLPAGERPTGLRRIDSTRLQESDVARILRNVTARRPPGADDGDEPEFRLSLAGAQEKTALLRLHGKWHRPSGATPTTHILKLPLGLVGGRRLDLTHSVENEWLCAQMLDGVGLPVAPVEICCFDDEKALAVERFDRRFAADGRWILRLPQEDFCQATGQPPHKKYEADGGPRMADCLTVLAASENSDADRRTLRAHSSRSGCSPRPMGTPRISPSSCSRGTATA